MGDKADKGVRIGLAVGVGTAVALAPVQMLVADEKTPFGDFPDHGAAILAVGTATGGSSIIKYVPDTMLGAEYEMPSPASAAKESEIR